MLQNNQHLNKRHPSDTSKSDEIRHSLCANRQNQLQPPNHSRRLETMGN